MRRRTPCTPVVATLAASFALLACVGVGAYGAEDDDLPLPDRRLDAGSEAALEDAGSVIAPAPDAAKDAATDAGCGDAGPGCERIVFVTSTSFTGNGIGGFAGADAKCQASADVSTRLAVRGGRFGAWISTNKSAVKDRLVHGTASYRKVTGAVVATSWADLVDGTLVSGIDEDENGTPITGRTWTGTNTAGENGPDQCDAWSPSGNSGRAGIVGEVGPGWTSQTNDGCGQTHRLYCFQE